MILSTVHKAKGREWFEVKLGNDFDGLVDKKRGGFHEEELNILYVACTRAIHRLDISECLDVISLVTHKETKKAQPTTNTVSD